MVGVRVYNTAAEIEHKLGIVKIPVVVVLAPGELLSGPLAAFTDGGVIAFASGAIGGQEGSDDFAGAGLHTAVVEHELFRVTLIAQFF